MTGIRAFIAVALATTGAGAAPAFGAPGAEAATVRVGSAEAATVRVGSAEAATVRVGSAEAATVRVGSAEAATVRVGSAEAATVRVGSAEAAGGAAAADTVARRTARMVSRDGFIPVYYEPASGKLFLEVNRLDTDVLYLNTLATGMGTNRVLLDRGQIGEEAVVRFERHGPRVMLVRRNLGFRAVGGDAALQRSVEESFPTSVLAAMPIEAESDGRLLVDATGLLLSDVFGVATRLRAAGETVRVDQDRSYIRIEDTRAFPANTEIRSVITYAADEPGPELRRHSPDGRSVTLQQHHSFVELPEPGFRPRAFDPRAGLFGTAFHDFARPFDQDYETGYIVRWRLEKRDPNVAISEPVRPIVYYLDPAVPEPYRTAFIEGGMWWNEIFEAAGFRNAFRIEDLPDGVDPMDARYSVIQWVHRSEPGPSVGPSFRDPRTGEIIRTVIRMDSHRSLVNYDIYAGLRPALQALGGEHPAAEAFAMARRRQHSAHEIGHTLGLAHNFLAASQGRTSVMDYPYPLIGLDGAGRLDLSRIYREGGGAHDTLAIRYAYTPFPTRAEEAAGLERIIREATDAGLRFITGFHAAPGSSHPAATQWIEGEDMVDALERTLAVRRVLLEHFDERALRPGEPMHALVNRFAHVYLHHRYALQGATKKVGGMEFTYALSGDGQPPTEVIPAAEQRRALATVSRALEPRELAVPARVPGLIPPSPFGPFPRRSPDPYIQSPAGTAFDPIGLAGSLAAEVVGGLLHPQRATRLVALHAADPGNPSLDEVAGALVRATFGAGRVPAELAPYRRVAERAVVDGLLDLADDAPTPEVRAVAQHRLRRLLEEELSARRGAGDNDAAHRESARRDIAWYLERGEMPERPGRLAVPLPWP